MNRIFVLFIFALFVFSEKASADPFANRIASGDKSRLYQKGKEEELCKRGKFHSCIIAANYWKEDGFIDIANIYYKTACFYNELSSCASVNPKYKLRELSKKFLKGICYPNATIPGCPNHRKPNKKELQIVANNKRKCEKDLNTLGCNLYAVFLFQIDKHDEAVKYIKKSCDLGQMIDCENLASIYYFKGRKKESFEMYNDLCYKKSLYKSCFALGLKQTDGKNFSEGKKAFAKACSGNFQNSCAIYQRVKNL